MKTERKYLNDWEKSILTKYGIKYPNKCGVQDLIAMLPKKWKEYGNWVYLRLEMYDGGWQVNMPLDTCEGSIGILLSEDAYGDTMIECLLNAVIRMAKRGRHMLNKACLAQTGLFEDDLYRVSERCDKKYYEI